MILHIENPKDGIRKLLELISEFSKVARYKINTQKSLSFILEKDLNFYYPKIMGMVYRKICIFRFYLLIFWGRNFHQLDLSIFAKDDIIRVLIK